MTIAEMVGQMIERGVDRETIMLAVQTAEECLKSTSLSADESADRRRARDRERQRIKREEARKSADNPQIPQTSADGALILKEDNNKKEKKVSRRHPCPQTFQPDESDFEYGEKLGHHRESVEAKAEDMRVWAGSTGALKINWHLTLRGFLRRDAPKQPLKPNGQVPTITPESPTWNLWKAHYRDTGNNFLASLMDKSASDGKPFTVPSERPAA